MYKYLLHRQSMGRAFNRFEYSFLIINFAFRPQIFSHLHNDTEWLKDKIIPNIFGFIIVEAHEMFPLDTKVAAEGVKVLADYWTLGR